MRRIIANLNYLFALVLFGSYIVRVTIAPPIRRLFLHGKGIPHDPIYVYFYYIIIALIIAIVSAVWWMRGNIIPTPVNSKPRILLMIGTVAIAIGNGALVLALIVSVIGVAVVPQFGLGAPYLFAAALLVALPLSSGGIMFVELSRLLERLRAWF